MANFLISRTPPPRRTFWATWFHRVHTRRDVVGVIRACAGALYVIAAVYALAYFWLGISAAIYAVLYGLGAFLLTASSSARVGLGLIGVAGSALAVTLTGAFGGFGSTNVGVGLVVLWVGVRALYATRQLRRLATTDESLSQVLAAPGKAAFGKGASGGAALEEGPPARDAKEICPGCGEADAKTPVATRRWLCTVCGTRWRASAAARPS